MKGEHRMADDDSWEARMAGRASERRAQKVADLQAAAEERDRSAYEASAQRPWLNGWNRGRVDSVTIGNGFHCVCCGRAGGSFTVAITDDWEPPGPEPVWPFTVDDCPLCSAEAKRAAAEWALHEEKFRDRWAPRTSGLGQPQ